MLELSKRKINCSIFLSKDGIIGALYLYIFEADSYQEKTVRTRALLEEAREILNCSDFDRNKKQCRMCQRICRFREEAIG